MPFTGYPTGGRDYTYYGAGPTVKRQRTSMDFGSRPMYDADGRIRQMDTYPQAAPTMFSNAPGTYQTPMMPGYAGHAGIADYAARQPTAAIVSSTYGPSEDPMLAVRSPGSVYPGGYPTYTAQMSYGMPPSTQVPMTDPSAASRSSQQAMQSLMPVNQPGTPVGPSLPDSLD